MKRTKKQALVLTMAALAPTDREKMWAAMRLERSFTQLRIAGLTGCGKSKVQDYLKGLMAAGFVTKRADTAKRFTKAVYDLVNDTGVDAPRVRTDGTMLPASGRNRMWNAMRVLGLFTVEEIAEVASLPETPIATSEAAYYCRWLEQGGYLTRGGSVYKFIPAKFTGAKAPQILRVKKLFDPNLGAVVCEAQPEGRDDE